MRPAFNLDGSQVLYAAAVGNGQFKNQLGIEKIENVKSGDFRLVLMDTNRNFTVTNPDIAIDPGEKVTLEYQGAVTDPSGNEYISVMIMNDDNTAPLYYGKVALAESENGTVEFDLPEDLTSDKYRLRVFNEKYRGLKESGISSRSVDVTLTIQQQTVSKVDLTIDEPVSGEKSKMAAAKEKGCKVVKTEWDPNDSVFKPNTAYSVSIEVRPSAGCTFAENMTFTLNGQEVEAIADGSSCIIKYGPFPNTGEDTSGGGSGEGTDPDSGTEGENGGNTDPDNGTDEDDHNSDSDNDSDAAADSDTDNGTFDDHTDFSNTWEDVKQSKPVFVSDNTDIAAMSRPVEKPSVPVVSENKDSIKKDEPSEQRKENKEEVSEASETSETSEANASSSQQTEESEPDDTAETSFEAEPTIQDKPAESANKSSLNLTMIAVSIPVLGFGVFFALKRFKFIKK